MRQAGLLAYACESRAIEAWARTAPNGARGGPADDLTMAAYQEDRLEAFGPAIDCGS